MTTEDLDRFLDEGASGQEVMKLLKGLLGDEKLCRRLTEELLLHAAGGDDALLAIDRFLLDDFYNDRTPMPLRARILAALCADGELRKQLEQIDAMYVAAEEYQAEATDEPPPDEVAEIGAGFDSGKRLTLATIGAVQYRWRIEEGCAGFDYEIKPRAAADLLGEVGDVGLVDEAIFSRGPVRCAIVFDPRERRLEFQISGCPLTKEEFERAKILLVGPAGGSIEPFAREHSESLSVFTFAGVDPIERYRMEIDPALIGG